MTPYHCIIPIDTLETLIAAADSHPDQDADTELLIDEARSWAKVRITLDDDGFELQVRLVRKA